jgi:membrane protease YdiL (CAAX protease family)
MEKPPVRYSLRRIAAIWVGAALPVLLIARVLVPWLSPRSDLAPVQLLWLLMPLAIATQFALVAWAVRRDMGSLTRESVKQRLRLELPADRAGRPGAGRLWWILPWAIGHLLITALTLILPLAGTILLILRTRGQSSSGDPFLWLRPMNFFDHTSAVFAAQWWWVAWILVIWAASACAEEFLFRGVLLPVLKENFGRAHGFMNGLLFAFYSIPNPWALPFRLLSTVALVRPARKLGSTLPALAIRGVEGLFLAAFLILAGHAQPFRSLSGCSFPTISRRPPPAEYHSGTETKLPPVQRHNTRDLRSRDLSELDLRNITPPASRSDFDNRTKWPTADRMPAGFDPARILELGKDPGLGVRQLHAQGITGRPVGIAIIDTVLLTGHEEYAANLEWYEEFDVGPGEAARMHAASVASIAVGRTVGVAPGARLFFIGVGDYPLPYVRSFSAFAGAVRRVIELNRGLPDDRKIRVLSMSTGWQPGYPGGDELDNAVEDAKAAGIFVISTVVERVYGFKFDGLGRPELADPNRFESYEPAIFWAEQFYRGGWRERDLLLVPKDSRATASPTGTREYVFYRAGGLSWSIPYIAGAYALAAQVDPGITPQKFWNVAMLTGRIIALRHGTETIPFGPIIDPQAIVTALMQPACRE